MLVIAGELLQRWTSNRVMASVSTLLFSTKPLTPTVAMGTAVPDRVKQSFVIFDIRAL